MPGCGSGLTDPPLKRRSARKRGALRIVPPVWRQCAGAQRLLMTTARLDRHQGPSMPDRPIG